MSKGMSKWITTIDSDDDIEKEIVSDEDADDNNNNDGKKDKDTRKRKAVITLDKQTRNKEIRSSSKAKAFNFDFDDSETINSCKFYLRYEDDDDDDDSSYENDNDNYDEEDDQNENDNHDNENDNNANDNDNNEDNEDCDEDVIADEEIEDNVRSMPRSEERAKRAEIKASNKGKKLKEMGEFSKGMDSKDEKNFFESVLDKSIQKNELMFSQLNLSRPILRAIEAAGYVTPTNIQSSVIPLAMAGRDICASAVTGSGKTAAFVLPFLERLLYRPKDVSAIRVLVLTPTRELATQIYQVLQSLSRFTDITSCLICGGSKDVKSQEANLRNRPDVIVCTPGRIIDHLRNSHSVTVDDLDVLVLDEVDRLLDMGFQEEVEELLKYCPTSRQTLLFSATMTPKVEDLAKLSLKRPVRVKTALNTTTLAPRLIQEFVRVRKEDEKEAMLAALVARNFSHRCIIFFETKKEVHRFCIILELLGIKVSELHGDISQPMRYLALQKFKDHTVDVMVCTDVAARGLDIPRIETVINAEMPRNPSTYVHRVGRTARAGCGGRAVTFVSDHRRKVMKEVLKGEGSSLSIDGGQVLNRTIPSAVIDLYIKKITSLEQKVANIYNEEKTKKRFDEVEREVEKAENLMQFENEINSRPARTWYQTEQQKKELKIISKQKAKEEELEAQYGKKKVNEVLSAEKKLLAIAKADDYRSELEKKGHRLSRKKRRKLEALKNIAEEEASSNKRSNIDLAPRRAKVSARESKEKVKDKLISEIGNKRTTNGKIMRPKIAIGGIDQDIIGWESSSGSGLSKKQRILSLREKEFTPFDTEKKLRKGGKIGNSSFKSKKKFKRR